jgi:hypothetical protein
VNPTKGHSPVGIASESNNLLSYTSSFFSWVPPIEHLPHCIAGSGFGRDPVVLDFIREQSGTASDAACMCRTSYSLECHHLLQTVVSLVERKVLNSSLMGTGEGRRPACPPGDLEKKTALSRRRPRTPGRHCYHNKFGLIWADNAGRAPLDRQ